MFIPYVSEYLLFLYIILYNYHFEIWYTVIESLSKQRFWQHGQSDNDWKSSDLVKCATVWVHNSSWDSKIEERCGKMPIARNKRHALDYNELSKITRTIFLKNDGKFLKIRQTKLASCRQYRTDKRGLKIILSTFKNVCPSLNFENRPSLYILIKETCRYGHIWQRKSLFGGHGNDKRNLPPVNSSPSDFVYTKNSIYYLIFGCASNI